MKCKTRDFGEIEVREEDVLEFIQPPFGFEEYRKYTIIRNEEFGDEIVWLQSIEEPSACFLLLDPSELASFYAPSFPESLLKDLGDGELICWVIGVVPLDFKKTTLNLKSPIIINPRSRKGAQVILEQEYPVRYCLMQEAQ